MMVVIGECIPLYTRDLDTRDDPLSLAKILLLISYLPEVYIHTAPSLVTYDYPPSLLHKSEGNGLQLVGPIHVSHMCLSLFPVNV